MRIPSILLILISVASCSADRTNQADIAPVSFHKIDGHFALSVDGQPVPMVISQDDYPGVIRVFGDLSEDIERVIHQAPLIRIDSLPTSGRLLLAGTIGRSSLINQLAEEGKIEIEDLAGRWEMFRMQVVKKPFPGIDEALVIIGSDKRGTMYGIYELSKQIGVSPWVWWADVPVMHQPNLFVNPKPFTLGEPKVKYRGIFLNNENPSLLGWVNHTFGGFNHEFYGKVFELILRNKGNYLWPAMWGKAFHDDDPLNAKLADEYGVVIGYTHHEPMARAHVEWARYGNGPWNYETNSTTLNKFWSDGIARLSDYESSVTLGMRGDGDEPMSDEANIQLMERIFRDQREILDKHHQDPSKLLQIWALYKEVQDYYEKGLRVPDDVLILLANDNWGNIRLLPDPNRKQDYSGGWGMYYHFDYVGGPRNYKWVNTVQISRIWEQMGLAWKHKVDRLWLVNVGDLKPMEFPISFFLDYAWDPDAMTVEKMNAYPEAWATQQFGATHAAEIGRLLTEYTRFNSRRKPELLSPDTYSVQHFGEAERVVAEYNALVADARRVRAELPQVYHDAYDQLLTYPIEASANLNELYVTVAKNRLYASEGRAMTNELAEKARWHFAHNDRLDSLYHSINDGKWIHMMSQTRIGYTYWQQPEVNAMPEVKQIGLPTAADMGVFTSLPVFDRHHQQTGYVEIYNRGRTSFEFSIQSDVSWMRFSQNSGLVDQQERVQVSVEWNDVPTGQHRVPIRITQTDGRTVDVVADVDNRAHPGLRGFKGPVEQDGYIAIEAPQFTRNIKVGDVGWLEIPQLGRTSSSMTPFPVISNSMDPVANRRSPRLEYDVFVINPGVVKVTVYLSPTLNYSKDYRHTDGIRFGLSFDDQTPQTLNMHAEMEGGFHERVWDRWVADNIIKVTSTHTISNAGKHTLKLWMMDTGAVVQRIIIQTKDIGSTYLGPPVTRKP